MHAAVQEVGLWYMFNHSYNLNRPEITTDPIGIKINQPCSRAEVQHRCSPLWTSSGLPKDKQGPNPCPPVIEVWPSY
jgi:hypothetical protein